MRILPMPQRLCGIKQDAAVGRGSGSTIEPTVQADVLPKEGMLRPITFLLLLPFEYRGLLHALDNANHNIGDQTCNHKELHSSANSPSHSHHRGETKLSTIQYPSIGDKPGNKILLVEQHD
jgi:hypothetical protein